MKIEHTRTHGFDGSPIGKKWWTIEHNGKQYVVKRDFNSRGMGGNYEFVVEDHIQRVVEVNVTPSTFKVSAKECDFIDVTLAVQLVRFIEEEKSNG